MAKSILPSAFADVVLAPSVHANSNLSAADRALNLVREDAKKTAENDKRVNESLGMALRSVAAQLPDDIRAVILVAAGMSCSPALLKHFASVPGCPENLAELVEAAKAERKAQAEAEAARRAEEKAARKREREAEKKRKQLAMLEEFLKQDPNVVEEAVAALAKKDAAEK